MCCHSMFLALLIGWYLLLTNLGMLINQAHYKKVCNEFMGNSLMMLTWGCLAIIFGLLIVIRHNVWESDWRILVTLIGWLVLLQGAFRLLFPEASVRFMKELHSKVGCTLLSWIWLLIGLYLIWVGHTSAAFQG